MRALIEPASNDDALGPHHDDDDDDDDDDDEDNGVDWESFTGLEWG